MIRYLFQNRYRPSWGSREWSKYWAKRLLLLPQLVGFSWRQRRFIKGCKSFGERTVLSPVKVGGHLDRMQIGSDCAIGRVEIQLHAPVTIGNCVVINDGCKLLTGTHDLDSPHWELIAKPIIIEDYAWIATDAILLPGTIIGKGAVVGAGAVVSKSVPALAVVAGNPAREMRQRTEAVLNYRPSAFYALFEAWLGPHCQNRDIKALD